MPRQTPDQFAAFQALCRANNLDPKADVWQQKQSGQWIIGRTGIEKIQALNHITIELDAVGFGLDFAGVKCTAARSVKAEGAKTAKKLSITSFGSAQAKNSQVSYYLEMAEKRAKSRAVLMLMGFYALGIYGEDEAEDFQRRADSISGVEIAPAPAQPAGNVGGASPAPSAPPVTPAASPSAAPAPSAGYALSNAEVQQQLAATRSTLDLKDLWNKLPAGQQAELKEDFTAARTRIAAAVQQAATTVAREQPAAMKEAGSSTELVDEFAEKPVFGPGPAVDYATQEQTQHITRLLNHPLITRKEKTKLLLTINRLDRERARQAIIKLGAAIGEREGTDPRDAVRASIYSFVQRNAPALTAQQYEDLRSLAADPAATLDLLVDALELAERALVDDETYGTDAELEHLEQEMAA